MKLKNWTETLEKRQALSLWSLSFFTLVFGIIELGRALSTWNTIVQATQAGAHYAAVENTMIRRL
jgi:Flp pilus assembly protein TadG